MPKAITYCKVEDCDTHCKGGGYCNKHYLQVRRHGQLLETTRFDIRPSTIDGAVAKIPLGINAKNGYAIVEAADSWVGKYRWYLNANGYPMTRIDGECTLLHKLLLDRVNKSYIDHEDGDKLNNRRSNLRRCTQSENMMNSRIRTDNTTGYRGVWFSTREKRYIAEIMARGKKYRIGTFTTAEAAAVARDAKAAILHGEFARLNFNKIGAM